MLPVVRNRSFHVPHGLAALAAAICLILAFSAEDSQQQLAGSSGDSETFPAAMAAKEQHENHSGQDKRTSAHQSATQSLPTVWIPWFPGRRPAG